MHWAEVIDFTARGLIGAGLYMAMSIVVGLTLLEIPFSLPFAVICAIVMVLLGAATIFRVMWPCSSVHARHTAPAQGSDCRKTSALILAGVMATLALIAGILTLVVYFRARSMGPILRLCIFCVLGMAVTSIVTHNLIVVLELFARLATEALPRFKAGLIQYGFSKDPTAPEVIDLQNKQFALLFLSYLATGLYYGFMYGQLAGAEMKSANPRSRYSPWPPVASYLEFSLPVAAVVGFLAGLLVALMSYAARHSPALPVLAGAGGSKGVGKDRDGEALLAGDKKGGVLRKAARA